MHQLREPFSSRRLLALLVVGIPGWVAGCSLLLTSSGGTTGGPCKSTTDCPGTQVCLSSMCADPCTSAVGCSRGQACLPVPTGGNTCQPAGDDGGGADHTVSPSVSNVEAGLAESPVAVATDDSPAPGQDGSEATVPAEASDDAAVPAEGSDDARNDGGAPGDGDSGETTQDADAEAEGNSPAPFCSGPSACPEGGCSSRLVLFGGRFSDSSGATLLGDTWEWDGRVWTQEDADAATLPAARVQAGLGSVCGRTLLFGGFDGALVYFPDAWRWSGSLWSPLHGTPATPPFGSITLASVVSTGGRIWVFGGVDASGSVAQSSYVFDGQTWRPWALAGGPTPRAGAAIAASLNGQVVLFGGQDEIGNVLDDTWIWNGTNWTPYKGAVHPSAREQAAAAGANGSVVLFGGFGTNDAGSVLALGDTWVWDGVAWTEKVLANPPPPRFGAAAATLNDQAVLFGGVNSVPAVLDDTCTWNGSTWACARRPGPSARYEAAMTDLQ